MAISVRIMRAGRGFFAIQQLCFGVSTPPSNEIALLWTTRPEAGLPRLSRARPAAPYTRSPFRTSHCETKTELPVSSAGKSWSNGTPTRFHSSGSSRSRIHAAEIPLACPLPRGALQHSKKTIPKKKPRLNGGAEVVPKLGLKLQSQPSINTWALVARSIVRHSRPGHIAASKKGPPGRAPRRTLRRRLAPSRPAMPRDLLPTRLGVPGQVVYKDASPATTDRRWWLRETCAPACRGARRARRAHNQNAAAACCASLPIALAPTSRSARANR
jgi:hypothetical protein